MDGQIAVAQVTLNRVNSKRYPDTVCEVVFDPAQFAWTPYNPKVTDQKAWDQAVAIAIFIDQFDDMTGGATHYYAGSPPWWAPHLQYVGVIGNHTFMEEL